MTIIPFILQVAALVCLLLAVLGRGEVPWGWLGMFLWLLSLMVTTIGLHPAHWQ